MQKEYSMYGYSIWINIYRETYAIPNIIKNKKIDEYFSL